MLDLVYVVLMVAFFVATVGLARFCGALMRNEERR